MLKFSVWSILVTILLVIVSKNNVFGLSEEFRRDLNCPSDIFCECSIGTHYEIACPSRFNANITLHVEPQRLTNRVEIECNTLDGEIFRKLPQWNVGDTNVVKFNNCPTTLNTSIQSIFDRLGIQNVHTLIFLAQTTTPAESNEVAYTLPLKLFENIKHVKSLNFRANKIHLPLTIFEQFSDLEVLQISSANLSASSDRFFQNLSKLKRLHLWNNDLRNVSKEIFAGISSVIDLEINSCDINEFKSNVLEHLITVKGISFNGNRLIAIPKPLFQSNKAVEKIRISNNQLELNTLPNELFGRLPRLEAVWINDCSLIVLPYDLFVNSTNIQNISLAHNNLTELPVKIFSNQTNLLDLDLSFNDLVSLDDDIFNETIRLMVLRLSNNRLTNISRYLISGLNSLEELYLDNNNLHTVHLAAFDECSLRVLHLQNNFLDFQSFEHNSFDLDRASPFQNLHQLEVLNMRNNSMKSFLNDWHIKNVALTNLDLSFNQIEMIDFGKMFNIWKTDIMINMSNNKISKIRAIPQLKSNETQSQTVWILNHNPLKCDCSIIHFASILRNQTNGSPNSHMKFITDQLECTSPERFAKQRLDNVPLTDLICPLDKKNSTNKLCPDQCTCFVRTYDRTAVFNCSDTMLNKIPALPNIKSLGLQYYELHIENNNITTLAMGNSTGYENVNRIFAKNNSIANILPEHLPDNLFALDISANRLKRIDPGVLHKLNYMRNLQTVSFKRNPLICDCGAYDLKYFIETHTSQVLGINETICDHDKSLTLLNASRLCPIGITIILIILIAVIVASILLSTTVYYRYQSEIRVWMYGQRAFSWVFPSKSDDHKKFDAFILYSSFDEKFVVENLVAKLESGSKPFKVCLLMREIEAGDIVPDKIAKCAQNSRRTIVVLTPNSIDSFSAESQNPSKEECPVIGSWGLMGFRVANKMALDERSSRVIIIKKGDIGYIENLQPELKAYLNTNIFLEWGENQFFGKLRLAIAHPEYIFKNGISCEENQTNQSLSPA